MPNGDGRDFDEDNLPQAHILASPPPTIFTNEEFLFFEEHVIKKAYVPFH